MKGREREREGEGERETGKEGERERERGESERVTYRRHRLGDSSKVPPRISHSSAVTNSGV